MIVYALGCLLINKHVPEMKHLLLIIFILSIGAITISQAQVEGYGLSYKVLFPKNLEGGALSDLYETEDFSLGAQVSYQKKFTNWFGIDVPLRLGSVEVLEEESQRYRERMFVGLDGIAIAGIDPLKFPFGPYAMAGVGVDYQGYDEDFNVYFPVGFGVNIRVVREFLLNTEFQYRPSLDKVNSHYQVALGFVMNMGLPPLEPETAKLDMPALDADGDGVPDAEDKCPDAAGPAMFRGCPDSDNDGIIDSKDKCPNEAGPIATDGCPVNVAGGGISDDTDTDGDGVSDKNDNCPNLAGDPASFGCPSDDADNDGVVDAMDNCPSVPGLARFGGCPDSDADGVSDDKDACPNIVGLPQFSGCPDTDGDGITDASDACPTVAGRSEYNGCPNAPSAPVVSTPSPVISVVATETLEAASQAVEFETSRATLRPSSYVVLDKIVTIMNQYPAYNLEVEGHTDSIGGATENQKLSENRAKSCRDYLVRKGISADRVTYVGYGEKQPIADNRYMAGRKKNRRVMFKLR